MLQLMTDLGLIKSSSPGTYHLLPVALKSLEKLTIIVDQFMKGIKGQKVQLPTLTPTILWEQTGIVKKQYYSEKIKFIITIITYFFLLRPTKGMRVRIDEGD